jgi:hypothetical protein
MAKSGVIAACSVSGVIDGKKYLTEQLDCIYEALLRLALHGRASK